MECVQCTGKTLVKKLRNSYNEKTFSSFCKNHVCAQSSRSQLVEVYNEDTEGVRQVNSSVLLTFECIRTGEARTTGKKAIQVRARGLF